MEKKGRLTPKRLLLMAAACAMTVAALMACTAFADETAVEGPQPIGEPETAAEPAIALEDGSHAESSIDRESMPETFAAETNEFIPFAFNGYNVNSEHKNMLNKVNQLRASKGLGKLSWNANLTWPAAQRAAEIAFFFQHDRPNGDSCFTVHSEAYGENIAYIVVPKGTKTASAIFEGWKNSPGHLGNMLGMNYKSVAFGHEVIDLGSGAELHLWVQLFSFMDGSGSVPSGDSSESFLIPFYPDVAKSITATPKTLIVSGSSMQPDITIAYRKSDTLMAVDSSSCLLLPAGTTTWKNLVGNIKPANTNMVSYDAQTGILTSGSQVGKTKCTITLAPAPSKSTTFTAVNSKPANTNMVSYDAQTGILTSGSQVGKTKCTITLAPAPSKSTTFTAVNSPFTRLAGDSSAQTAALIAWQTAVDAGTKSSKYAVIARNDDFADAMSATGLAGHLKAPILLTSRTGWQTAVDAGTKSSKYAVIARNDDFADAMSATGLAGHLKAPILLTSRTGLSDAAATAIRDLGVTKVYIVGGPGAVLPKVETSIKDMGVKTERVYGEYSWDTSLKCAEKIHALGGNPKGEAIIAMSTNFQDALSISPLAYRYSIPILLQGNGTTIKIHALGGNPKGEAIIAMSTNFQDALSISPLAYRYSIPILLQGNGTTIPRKLTDGELKFITQKTTGTIWVPGGPVAVPEASVEKILGKNSPHKREIVRMYGYELKFITQKTTGTIWVPGGPVAVPEASVEKILGKNSPHKREIVRMYGYDGYDTSLEIAKTLVDRGRASESSVIIASGAQAPRGVDALAGAALAGTNNGVILLVNANPDIEGVHTEAVDGFMIEGSAGGTFMQAYRNGTAKGYILGGSYVMPYDYESKLAVAMKDK